MMRISLGLKIIGIVLITFKMNAQVPNIDLFECWSLEGRNVAFISVSEKYDFSEHPDSLAIPDTELMSLNASQYFKLNSKYRDRFLTKTGLSDTSNVVIYDYANDKMSEFQVKDLNVVANLNIYIGDDEWPYSQYEYQIGFEIDTVKLMGFDENYTLVYIGNENPFVQGQLQQIVWEEIEQDQFPIEAVTSKDTEYFKEGEYEIGTSHLYQINDLNYYIQELVQDDWHFAKRLIVINHQTGEKICETIYYTSEGSSFAPLDNQWTGNLFTNKQPVIFGFQWHSFGCARISFLNSKMTGVRVLCDNRH